MLKLRFDWYIGNIQYIRITHYAEASREIGKHTIAWKHLVLTEFESRTVSYGPSLYPFDLWLQSEKSAGYEYKGKNEGPLPTVRTERTRLLKTFIISLS